MAQMRSYLICLTVSLIATIGTFALVDAYQEADPHPVAYCEKLVRWIGGLE